MAKKIRVRVIESKRDGVVFRWSIKQGARRISRQRVYEGKQTRNKIEAARQELEDQLNFTGSGLRWSVFVDRYTRLRLRRMELRSQEKPQTMLNRFAAEMESRGIRDLDCSDLRLEMILAIEATMIDEGLSEHSIASNMRTLWAILNWGAGRGLLPRLEYRKERTLKSEKQATTKAKGRALTTEEIERMEQAIRDNPVIRPDLPAARSHVRKSGESAEQVLRAIRAIRLMGLRLEDSRLLSWEPVDAGHYPVNLAGRLPMLSISTEQKSGEQELIPLTPAAVEWLRSIECETGWVCRLSGVRGEHETTNRLGRIIANAGRAANVIVKPTGGKFGAPKYASAHDLRRTFVQEWLSKLNISEVRILSRHANIETLLRYYSDSTENALALKLKDLNSQSGGVSVGPENRESRFAP